MSERRGQWTKGGKAASARDIAEALALTRSHKTKRSKAEREARALDIDAKQVGKHIRRSARQKDQRYMAWLTVEPKRESGRNTGRTRCRRLETMTGLTFKAPSHKGSDGLSSFHFGWRSRGLRPRKGQKHSHRYRRGEAVRLVRYIMRDLAREIEGGGIVSNISPDPDEIASVFGALEELEVAGGRDNGNVYISIVISLPHELSSTGRERVLADVCAVFDEERLPHAGVLHKPDPGTDQRNHHAHVILSLRPIRKERDGRYSFATGTSADLNDEIWIKPLRERIATAINLEMRQLERETGSPQRTFTHLSREERGLQPVSKREGKHGPGRKARDRKMEDAEQARRELQLHRERLTVLDDAIELVGSLASRASLDLSVLLASARYAVQQHADARRAGQAPVSIRPATSRDRSDVAHERADQPLPAAAPPPARQIVDTTAPPTSTISQETELGHTRQHSPAALAAAQDAIRNLFQPAAGEDRPVAMAGPAAGLRRLSRVGLAGEARRARVSLHGNGSGDMALGRADDGRRGLRRPGGRPGGARVQDDGHRNHSLKRATAPITPPSPAATTPTHSASGGELVRAALRERTLERVERMLSQRIADDERHAGAAPRRGRSAPSSPTPPNQSAAEVRKIVSDLAALEYLPLRPNGWADDARSRRRFSLPPARNDDPWREALPVQDHAEIQALFEQRWHAMLARLRAVLMPAEGRKRPPIGATMKAVPRDDRAFVQAVGYAVATLEVEQVAREVQKAWADLAREARAPTLERARSGIAADPQVGALPYDARRTLLGAIEILIDAIQSERVWLTPRDGGVRVHLQSPDDQSLLDALSSELKPLVAGRLSSALQRFEEPPIQWSADTAVDVSEEQLMDTRQAGRGRSGARCR